MCFYGWLWRCAGDDGLCKCSAQSANGWVAGLGVAALVMLDIGENLTMIISLDMLNAGDQISPARIGWQAGISGAKWLVAALSVVALTFTLPQNTWLERLWSGLRGYYCLWAPGFLSPARLRNACWADYLFLREWQVDFFC